MVIVVDNCRYDVGCKKTFNNFKKKNKVFLKITSTCSKLYIYSISNFFGGLFLLFLFPTGCVHSQFKSTKVIFIKVGGGHTTSRTGRNKDYGLQSSHIFLIYLLSTALIKSLKPLVILTNGISHYHCPIKMPNHKQSMTDLMELVLIKTCDISDQRETDPSLRLAKTN